MLPAQSRLFATPQVNPCRRMRKARC
jgi:hypothetical protein